MLFMLVVVLALAVAVVLGGDPRALASLRFRRAWLLPAALAIQVLVVTVFPGPKTTARVLFYLGSYVLAVVFLLLNRAIPGLWIVGAGAFLNLVAIVANAGVMPATAGALSTAGIRDTGAVFANSATVEHARLWFLGDVFALPASWPLANVFSVGDVLIAVGAAWTILRTTRRPSRRTPAPEAG
jgi:hypothetical protein